MANQIFHNEQTAVGVSAQWSGWNLLSRLGDKASVLRIAAHPDGRMHAIMAGQDSQLWHSEQLSAGISAEWTNWHQLSQPGDRGARLELVAHPDGRMHAVMIGTDGQLWHNEQTGATLGAEWTGWHPLSASGDKAKFVTLAVHRDGRAHAIMAGLDNQIWHNEQLSPGLSSRWTGWHELSQSGDKGSLLALAAHRDGRMHALKADLERQVWHNEQISPDVSAGWTGWHHLSSAGDLASSLALAAHRDGRMHAIIGDLKSGQLWHNEQVPLVREEPGSRLPRTVATPVSAAWTGWQRLSRDGDRATAVALAAHQDGRMHAVIQGIDGQIWHNEQTSGVHSAAWTGWNPLSAISDKAEELALAVHPDGRMHAIRQTSYSPSIPAQPPAWNMRTVALRAFNGQYVAANNGGAAGGFLSGAYLIANRDNIGAWETFALIRTSGDSVAIRCYSGRFVCAEYGGGEDVVANREQVGPWETFTMVSFPDGKVGFRTMSGHYLCAEHGGGEKLVADRTSCQAWEQFTLVDTKALPVPPLPKQFEVKLTMLVKGVYEPSEDKTMYRLIWPGHTIPNGPIVDIEAPQGFGYPSIIVQNLKTKKKFEIPPGGRLDAQFKELLGTDAATSLDLFLLPVPNMPAPVAVLVNLIQRIK